MRKVFSADFGRTELRRVLRMAMSVMWWPASHEQRRNEHQEHETYS